MSEEVVCVDFWANGFGMRVRIALREKGVQFELKEEDLRAKERSALVLEMSPVLRQIPILIHHGKPVLGSINIVEYIDEVWKEGPALLPADPLDRAHARLWAHYIDKMLFSTQTKFLKSKGEAKEKSKAELIESLKQLEQVLGDGNYFGGDEFNFLDIMLIPFSSMFSGYEEHGSFQIGVECPKLMAWVKRCRERESVARTLPDDGEMYQLHKAWYGIE
ncbi:Glutathione S-transferase family protein [Rhynchospora pubera]|uniref:Glutathione S-transferase n=1 Tax=Rhynchospora pubera TaxID=906938 RepID=A0AAV8FTQ8_9POAL|nr:Glutathione S-transferase family protein [Rhynchospora pubera]KAJ4794183.1 Glutathione S-transferase family protein [Rhynchospora pubera]